MNLAEFHERVCEPPLAQGEEKVRVTAVLLCFDSVGFSLGLTLACFGKCGCVSLNQTRL